MLNRSARRRVHKVELRFEGSDRKIRETVDLLSHGGLPVNPSILQRVQQMTHNGEFGEDRAALVADVKSDPGLFMHLARTTKTESHGRDPIALLRQLEDEKLTEIFSSRPQQISRHQLGKMSKFQGLRLQHALLRSYTAASLADHYDISSDLAFSTALFQNLGLDLIAWNFPNEYSRALTGQRRGDETLEVGIERLLGVSPIQLSLELANEFRVAPEIRGALQQVTHGLGEVGAGLADICVAAEAYAQSKDIVTYPRGKRLWDRLDSPIKKTVEGELAPEVEAQLEQVILLHAETIPSIESLPFIVDHQERTTAKKNEASRVAQNKLIANCPRHVQEQFLTMYDLIEDTQVSLAAIRYLVDDIIPQLGFARGCLFMIQKDDYSLTPALRIGDTALAAYEKFLRTIGGDLGNAVNRKIPIRTEALGVRRDLVSCISAAFDHSNHPGVLYLEIDDKVAEDPNADPLQYFRTVERALQDCFQ